MPGEQPLPVQPQTLSYAPSPRAADGGSLVARVLAVAILIPLGLFCILAPLLTPDADISGPFAICIGSGLILFAVWFIRLSFKQARQRQHLLGRPGDR